MSLNSDRASNDSSSYTEYNLQLDLEEVNYVVYQQMLIALTSSNTILILSEIAVVIFAISTK